jgi:hypothetical protein
VAQSGCPILVRAFCAAEPGPHRARCWRGGVERGIASLPTSSKLRVPHIPGVGMWESCKARPFPHPRTIRVPHPGARFFAQQCGTASLPTRSKLRVPHSGARRFSWCAPGAFFRAAGWDSVAPNQIKAPGAPHPWCWDVGVVQSTTLLPPQKSIVFSVSSRAKRADLAFAFRAFHDDPVRQHQSCAAG